MDRWLLAFKFDASGGHWDRVALGMAEAVAAVPLGLLLVTRVARMHPDELGGLLGAIKDAGEDPEVSQSLL